MLSERPWKREFASDPAVIGRPILINGRPFDVIGVAARYHGPEVACRVAAGASRDESGSDDRAEGGMSRSLHART